MGTCCLSLSPPPQIVKTDLRFGPDERPRRLYNTHHSCTSSWSALCRCPPDRCCRCVSPSLRRTRWPTPTRRLFSLFPQELPQWGCWLVCVYVRACMHACVCVKMTRRGASLWEPLHRAPNATPTFHPLKWAQGQKCYTQKVLCTLKSRGAGSFEYPFWPASANSPPPTACCASSR